MQTRVPGCAARTGGRGECGGSVTQQVRIVTGGGGDCPDCWYSVDLHSPLTSRCYNPLGSH